MESLIELRRNLHASPELRFREHQTVAMIASELEGFADNLTTIVGGVGLIAHVAGQTAGPVVLVRADIDAYPVADNKSVSYASQAEGITHACGHDVHAAVGVGVVRHFSANRPRRGSLIVVFQPAEEIPFGEASGAVATLADPFFAGLSVDAVLGLHCWPQLDAGQIGIEQSIAMAAKDAFEATLSGTGAHVATPAGGRDAILAAGALIVGLHAAVARRHDPQEQVAFNVGTVAGGRSQSALASEVKLTGTIRTHEESVRVRLKETVEAAVSGIGIQFEMPTSLRWANEMPAVVNHASLVELARRSVPEVAELVDIDPGPMTTDDFALYADLAPSLYLKLGVAAPGSEVWPSLHSGDFDVDERCIAVGVDVLSQLCRELFERE